MDWNDPKLQSARQRLEAVLERGEPEEMEELRLSRNKMADEMNELHAKTASRWSLSLGIGNGAALTAVGSKMLGAQIGPWTYLLMPSALCFGAGLCAVGISHGLAIWRVEHKARVLEAQNNALALSNLDLWRDERLKLTKQLWLIETYAEITAAVLFVAGIMYPLLVLWFRLVRNGSLIP